MFEFTGEITAKINGCWVLENKQGLVEFGDNGIAYQIGQEIKATLEPTKNESCIKVQSKVIDAENVRINLNRAYVSIRKLGDYYPGYFQYAADYWTNVSLGDNYKLVTEVV